MKISKFGHAFVFAVTILLTIACTNDSNVYEPKVSALTIEACDSNRTLYYYYQGKKIHIKVNTTAYYAARINAKEANEQLSSTHYYTFGQAKQANRISKEENDDFMLQVCAKKEFFKDLTSLQSTNSVKEYITKLHNTAKNDDDISYITPCFVSDNNEEFSNSPYIYVKLKESKDTTLFKNILNKFSLNEFEEIDYMPLWYKVSCFSNKQYCPIELANKIYETGLFESAEPGFIGIVHNTASHRDTYYQDQWGLENIGQYNGKNGIDIKANQAHSLSGGQNITVAVVDCGVDYSHPDLSAYPYSYDAYKGKEYSHESVIYKTNIYDVISDEVKSVHGTACAGIIGAIDNEEGVCGVAPSSTIASVSLPIELSDLSVFAKGIAWACNKGIDVISCSWGIRSGEIKSDILDSAIKQAVNNGRNGKGCIVVFSVGNDNKESISYPASLDDVISVGAIDMFGKRKDQTCCYENQWGSNYGNGLDVVAPGLRISTTDITSLKGMNIGNSVQSELVDYPNPNYTKVFNGTSAATPFVAGIAALILERKPNLTSKDVKRIILTTCTKLPAYSFTNSTTEYNETWNKEVGYGLVNAYNAVSKAITEGNKYAINGQPTITNTNWNTFSVSNVPRGTFVEWSISDNVNFTISQNGYNSVLVKAKQTGKSAILTANISTTSSSIIQSVSIEISSLFK